MAGARYRAKDGRRVPRVSTILGTLGFGGDGFDAGLRWALKHDDPNSVGRRARDTGTIAHAYLQRYVVNRRDPTKEERAEIQSEFWQAFEDRSVVANARRCYVALRDHIATLEIDETIASEVMLVSEEHGFGGTPDLVVRLKDGRHMLVDFKTTAGPFKAASNRYLHQLAAYRQLVLEGLGVSVDAARLLVADYGGEGGAVCHVVE